LRHRQSAWLRPRGAKEAGIAANLRPKSAKNNVKYGESIYFLVNASILDFIYFLFLTSIDAPKLVHVCKGGGWVPILHRVADVEWLPANLEDAIRCILGRFEGGFANVACKARGRDAPQ